MRTRELLYRDIVLGVVPPEAPEDGSEKDVVHAAAQGHRRVMQEPSGKVEHLEAASEASLRHQR